ncbi:hypothetical protein GWI34_03385 [Actinomadura sp. DSM 109109]|nr:hypothetical protein [Actinomadura lepetitiana]
MSFPIRRPFAVPYGQQDVLVPQLLKWIEMAAGDEVAGLRREVGGPRRPLRGASLEACERMEALVKGLDLRGMFPKQEAVIDTTVGRHSFAYAGYRNGGETDHWWIGGDLDHAFGSASEVITLLVGAGSLRGRRRPAVWTANARAGLPLNLLASERDLEAMDGPITAIDLGSNGHLLGTMESLWLLAGSVAKLVRALPEDGPRVRVLLRVPTEEHWLPLVPALQQNLVSRELCADWFDRTTLDRGDLARMFTEILGEQLGEYTNRVTVAASGALHHIGSRLTGAVDRGEKLTAPDLHDALREEDGFWQFVLSPQHQEAVGRGLFAEGRLALKKPFRLDGLAGLVGAADVVDLLKFGSEGPAIVVDDARAAWRMLDLAQRFARHLPGGARMAGIGPLSKILGGSGGSYGPFGLYRGAPNRVTVLDPVDPTRAERVRVIDLFNELYSVR